MAACGNAVDEKQRSTRNSRGDELAKVSWSEAQDQEARYGHGHRQRQNVFAGLDETGPRCVGSRLRHEPTEAGAERQKRQRRVCMRIMLHGTSDNGHGLRGSDHHRVGVGFLEGLVVLLAV